MKLETEVTSQKTVRPSSPTPHHLGRHKLSSLDQVVPTYFIPWLFFYPDPNKAKAKAKAKSEADIDNNNEEKKEETVDRIIEKSLSEALTVFYPLAGRMKDNTHVECNDEGVHFAVAQANCPMSVVLQNPHRCGINKLLPFKPDDPTEFLAFVQVTHFKCRGMAIGLGFSHKIGDGESSVMFLNTWAALARGEETKNISAATPLFDSADYFPPIPDISNIDPGSGVVKDKNIVTGSFVFSAKSIDKLRKKYEDENFRRPTQFEALNLFIWSRFMATTQVDAEAEDKTYAVRFPVNLRPKMDPPLSEYHFGNIIVELVVEVPKEGDLKSKRSAILKKIGHEICRIDSNYVKTIREAGDKYFNKIKKQAEQVDSGKVLPLDFTPRSSVHIYEVDFGWGKPAWVGSVGPYKNLVTYADTPKGDGGIEVLMYLTEQDMAKFKVDEELAAFASVSPPQDYFTS